PADRRTGDREAAADPDDWGRCGPGVTCSPRCLAAPACADAARRTEVGSPVTLDPAVDCDPLPSMIARPVDDHRYFRVRDQVARLSRADAEYTARLQARVDSQIVK